MSKSEQHEWREVIIPLDSSIRAAAQSLDRTGKRIVLIVDQGILKGIVTDGDIRHALLEGKNLEAPVHDIMVTDYFAARENDDDHDIAARMREQGIQQAPVLDAGKRLVGLKSYVALTSPKKKSNWIVLMAGGLGTRLRPLTSDCPKPMLSVGGRPLLETIIRQFSDQGFENFYISVNYRAEIIEEHFKNGADMCVNITYLRENEQLGTAGAIGLLPEPPTEPIFVMNGDLLTRVNFSSMLAFNQTHGACATMAVRSFDVQVPYGVVQVENNTIHTIEEKPVHSFFVNAGIYVLTPEVVRSIPKHIYLDMPALFDQLMQSKKILAAFPIHEYWMDIGRHQDFEKANSEFHDIF